MFRNSIERTLEEPISISIILPRFGKSNGCADLVRPSHSQPFGNVQGRQHAIPGGLFQHKPQGALSERPGFPKEATSFFALNLLANIFDKRTNLLLEDIEVGLPKEN